MSQAADPVLELVIATAKKYKSVTKVTVFGSRAKETQTKTSDYDLAFEWNDKHGESWGAFAQELREGNPTLNGMDLVKWDMIGNELKARIAQEGKVIYVKD